jgi:hypothetical protein
MNQHNPQFDTDYTKAAAEHLRDKAREKGIEIRSSHAHALVAAELGYNSRAALLAPQSNHCLDDQWLHRAPPDTEQIRAAILRMRDSSLTEQNVPFIAETIQDGLAPPCCETGIRSAHNIPLGYVKEGDETEWVHPSAARDDNNFGHCRCCGEDVLYRIEELDDEMLCEEHHGEFDLDPEEQQDMDDFVEYMTKE